MTSKTFSEYINDLRVAKAMELLKQASNLNITDICYCVGFNNVTHFDRKFRQLTGISPTKYRRMIINS